MNPFRSFGNTPEQLYPLGFGTMRFPVKDGRVDEPEAIRLLHYAIDHGVNYVDTAYCYHDGNSEDIVGRALADGYRERVLLATKMPVWEVESEADFDRIFADQLKKLQTDHIDCYLLHALSKNTFENKVLRFDMINKVRELKKQGKIRYMGFSFHDDYAAFEQILNAADDWDFCQIQLNYVNTDYQAGLRGLRAAADRGMGVVIMEPLLGGRLAAPPQELLSLMPSEKSPVEWALDYLWDFRQVGVVLSGMSDFQQVQDNLAYADRSHYAMLTDADRTRFVELRRVYDSLVRVSCTGCRYCMPCPGGLDIPDLFHIYNNVPYVGLVNSQLAYSEQDKTGKDCLSCRACEAVCPQHLPISDLMSVLEKELRA